MESISLLELHTFIRQVLALNLGEPLWVRFELAQIKPARGHFFIDLVEKSEDGAGITAQGQAVLWNAQHKLLHRKLGLELGALLQEGMEVLAQVQVDFHERYGLKLVIHDFDAAYTLGRLELQRQATLRALQGLGLLGKNAALSLPPVLQRVAILSSETAAGYQDFIKQLQGNPYGYRFDCQLFAVAVQGQYVETEILRALERVAASGTPFDAVCILRGGGAKLDLHAFDNLGLCKAVAQFSLPVLSGIGHDVDETVLDLVAHTSLKTPTAVADFLIQHNANFEAMAALQAYEACQLATRQCRNAGEQLQNLSQRIDYQSHHLLQRQAMMLDFIEREVPLSLKNVFEKQASLLERMEHSIQLLSPETALRRGFSITTLRGKAIQDLAEVSEGDLLETRLLAGNIWSEVKKK